MSGMALTTLGEIAALQAGIGFPLDMQGRSEGDFPLAKVGDISRAGRLGQSVLSDADNYVEQSDLPRLKATPIPQGSILFAKIGEAIRQNHRVIAGCPLLIDNNAMAVVPTSRVESRFLYHFLRTVDLYGLASATTVPALRKSDLEKLQVPLPELPEQRRIVAILDAADALRATRRATLLELDGLPQAIFRDMFGDLTDGFARWPTVPLEAIVKDTKLGLVRGSQEFGVEFPIPYIRMNAITRTGELALTDVQRTHATEAEVEGYRLRPGDFLFNTRNSAELVGKTALFRATGLYVFNNNLMRIRFTADADPEFIAAAFRTPLIQHELATRKSGTTSVFAIYYKDLRSLPLQLPPITLQREFACRVREVVKVKESHRASLSEVEALFKSLQLRAFREEL
jgi:type I restriction enzyme S subunit